MEKSEILVNDFPRSPISESFRLFRTNLLYLFEDDSSKVICITSTNTGEGKSWVSANLAISCAQYGKKVLIIDSDLRKGRQHRIFKKSNRTGFSDLLKELRGKMEKDKVEKIEEELKNLNIKQYVECCPDERNPKSADYYVFSKKYQENQVYIKLKIQSYNNKIILCMSFHYAEYELNSFPYK